MHLDTPTVSLITVFVVCLECAILVALWHIHRGMRGVALWAAGALAIAAGVLGVSMRGALPPSASLIAANLVILAGFVLTWWGIEAFFQRPVPLRIGLGILAFAAVGLSYAGLIAADTRLRAALLLMLFALMSILRLYSLLRELRPGTVFSQVLTASVFGCQAVYNLTLAIMIWSAPISDRPITQMPISGWIFLIPMLLSIAAVFGAVLLVNQTISTRLQEAARRDALTDALTRRALEEDAQIEIARSHRHNQPLSLLLLDIDHFKLVNDRHGHLVGDDVLRQFAAATRQCLRREDIFGRLGGEEFCALLPSTSATGAAHLAERIRAVVEDLTIEAGGTQLSLQVSIGIAALGDHGTEWQDLIRLADAALYAAKHAGRNRVMLAGSDDLVTAS